MNMITRGIFATIVIPFQNQVVNVFYGTKKNYGPECDLWSLGVLIYTLIAGRTPFAGR